jgi:hypothetical protein
VAGAGERRCEEVGDRIYSEMGWWGTNFGAAERSKLTGDGAPRGCVSADGDSLMELWREAIDGPWRIRAPDRPLRRRRRGRTGAEGSCPR